MGYIITELHGHLHHLFACSVHGACDDVPERTTQCKRDIDVSSPLSIDMWHHMRVPLVFRWVVEGDCRGEVSWEHWELPLLGRWWGY